MRENCFREKKGTLPHLWGNVPLLSHNVPFLSYEVLPLAAPFFFYVKFHDPAGQNFLNETIAGKDARHDFR